MGRGVHIHRFGCSLCALWRRILRPSELCRLLSTLDIVTHIHHYVLVRTNLPSSDRGKASCFPSQAFGDYELARLHSFAKMK